MSCNCARPLPKSAVACPKCGGYKTTKKGVVTCPKCKNVFYVK